jgi:CheY-like chemotaxis protein
MRRVLIVEDESIVAMALEAMVRKLGHSVLAKVPTGEAALALSEEHPPDMVLMDIMLDGELDGVQTVQALRSRWHELPVVYVSAYGDKATRERAGRTDPRGYLTKPVSLDDLETLLGRAGNA